MEWTRVSGSHRPIGVRIGIDDWGFPYFYYGPNGGPGGYRYRPDSGRVYRNDPPYGEVADAEKTREVVAACAPFMGRYNEIGGRMNPATFVPAAP